MQQFGDTLIKWGGIALGLIFVYLLITHPNAVVSELSAVGGFVTAESKTLQGR